MTIVQLCTGDGGSCLITRTADACLNAVAGIGVIITECIVCNKTVCRAIDVYAVTDFCYITNASRSTAFKIGATKRPVIFVGIKIADRAVMIRVYGAIGNAGAIDLAKAGIAYALTGARFAKLMIVSIARVWIAGIVRAGIASSIPVPAVGVITGFTIVASIPGRTYTDRNASVVRAITMTIAGIIAAGSVFNADVGFFMISAEAVAAFGHALVAFAYPVFAYAVCICSTRIRRFARAVTVILKSSITGTNRIAFTIVGADSVGILARIRDARIG